MKRSLPALCGLFVIYVLITPSNLFAQRNRALFAEDFRNLNNWKPLQFPKIKKYSKYTIEKTPMDHYLKATSKGSASGIVYKKEFNIYDFPIVMWQWKVKNVYKKGNARVKAGDDYPLRIYIMFKYDSQKASFMDKIKYEAAKLLYGQYPPHSSLNYIWANKKQGKKIMTSPYTDRAKMIILQEGTENLNKWMMQEIDILKDYRKAFNSPPPPIASIGIMNDSDNTGESSTAYVNYIQVYRPKGK